MEYKLQGIVLGKVDVGETDRIYTIYTLEKGKIRILAKGVRKPNAKLAGSLETITQGEFFIAKNRGLGKITGAIVNNNFAQIKNNLQLTTDVLYVFRILNQMISEEEGDGKMFFLLENYLGILENLDGKKAMVDILTIGFLFRMMDNLGYRLEMDRCVYCEKKLILERNYLSISRGGILCSDCQGKENNKMDISNELIKLIRIFLKNKLESLVKIRIEARDAQKLRAIIKEAISWFSHSSFRV